LAFVEYDISCGDILTRGKASDAAGFTAVREP
jgi:hypothetical protein